MKIISFETNLFDSDEKVVVQFPYSINAKIFGLNYISIITLEEEKTEHYSDGSFNRIEKIIEKKYGLPEYCYGNLENLEFRIGSIVLRHSISEVRMGCYRHSIVISKEMSYQFRLAKYCDVVEMKNFVLDCIPKNMKISLFWFDKNSLTFIVESETMGYDCRRSHDKFAITPYKITKEKNIDNRTLISHKPIIEKKGVVEIKSIENIKEFIKDYFDNKL